jgi:cytidine deaminase
MKLDQNLVDAAIKFVDERFLNESWAGAAAMYAHDGAILISTSPDVPNESVSLCHETGAICEAYKLGLQITASVCVSRDERGQFHILTPCGVCQERLMTWGDEVEVAVPKDSDSTIWEMRRLSEVQPFYWKRPFLKKT